MKKYIVYLSTGERVCVEAENFEYKTDSNSESNNLWFFAKDKKYIAGFNFNNIQGFCLGYTSEEKEQKYYD